MERTQRLIFLVLVIGWTIFRLVRYVRMANSKRSGAAAPPPAGALPQRYAPPPTAPAPTAPASTAPAPRAPATAQSPIEPESRTGGGRAGLLAATAILVAGSALIWAILFAVPAFDQVPTIWRLTAGVFASLFLLRAASAVARARGRSRPPGSRDERNPIK